MIKFIVDTFVTMLHAHVETQANVYNHSDILREEHNERGESGTAIWQWSAPLTISTTSNTPIPWNGLFEMEPLQILNLSENHMAHAIFIMGAQEGLAPGVPIQA